MSHCLPPLPATPRVLHCLHAVPPILFLSCYQPRNERKNASFSIAGQVGVFFSLAPFLPALWMNQDDCSNDRSVSGVAHVGDRHGGTALSLLLKSLTRHVLAVDARASRTYRYHSVCFGSDDPQLNQIMCNYFFFCVFISLNLWLLLGRLETDPYLPFIYERVRPIATPTIKLQSIYISCFFNFCPRSR